VTSRGDHDCHRVRLERPCSLMAHNQLPAGEGRWLSQSPFPNKVELGLLVVLLLPIFSGELGSGSVRGPSHIWDYWT
jgi:hypothetical protein